MRLGPPTECEPVIAPDHPGECSWRTPGGEQFKCNRPAGHDGPHGFEIAGMILAPWPNDYPSGERPVRVATCWPGWFGRLIGTPVTYRLVFAE